MESRLFSGKGRKMAPYSDKVDTCVTDGLMIFCYQETWDLLQQILTTAWLISTPTFHCFYLQWPTCQIIKSNRCHKSRQNQDNQDQNYVDYFPALHTPGSFTFADVQGSILEAHSFFLVQGSFLSAR